MAAISGPNIPLDGLVFNMDPSSNLSYPNKSATTIKDIKNDVLGTFTNGSVYSNTQKGAISFIGANVGSAATSIHFSNNSIYDFQSSDFSISAWCNPREALNYGIIAGKWGGYGVSNVKSFALRQDNASRFQFVVSSNGSTETSITNSSTFSLGQWYHVCATRSGNNLYLYTNGILTASGSFTGSVYTGSTDLTIGAANNNTDTFKGNINKVLIYNKTLSSSEIKQIYNAEREKYVEIPKTISGLQLWLDGADLSTLRQNSNGTTAVTASSDPIGYWADKSGNGRNVLQATSSYRPVFAAGVKGLFPGVTFDGVDDFLESTASGATSIVDSTLIMVARWNDVSGTDTPVIVGRGYTGGGEVRAFYRPTGTTKFSWGTWNGDLGTTTIDVSQNTFNIFAATQAGNQIRLYKNYSYNSYTYGNTPASPTYNQWDIGGPNNGYDQYAGITIGEVLIFNKSLTHSEMLVLLAYLNGKWGIV